METASETKQETTERQEPQPPRATTPYIGRASAITRPRPSYAELLASETGRRWLLRGAVVLGVGAVLGLAAGSWRVGATIAGAVLIGYIVHTARCRSEIPRWRKPSAPQRKTESQLRLMKRFGYRVLHDRAIVGGNGIIDHFVVGRRGAFAIDSEAWDRRLPLRNKVDKLYHGKFSRNDRLDEALEEARTAQRLISEELGRDIFVRPSLAIYGPSMPWDILRIRGVDVFSGTKVRKWLRNGTERLTDQEIEEIRAAAERVMPPRS